MKTQRPQSLYGGAQMKLRRGDTVAALQDANIGLERFSSEKTDWHWRFLELKAEILHTRGLEQDCLSLLTAELPASLATSELAVRRKFTQGAASAVLLQLTDADRFLKEAEALAKANHPELLGEVALRKGTVHFMREETSSAEADYRKALQLAREQKDQFLEVSALTGLGIAATKAGHYDESIDWDRSAAELARVIGATGSLAKTLGNTGWSYAELGDYENALTFYKQAEEVAARNGLVASQARWLASIAYADQGLHDYADAERVLDKALRLARAQDSKETLVQCLSQLAWIALWTGKDDLAERYSREAAGLEKQVGARLAIDLRLLRGSIALNSNNYDQAEKSFQLVVREPQASKFQRWRAQAQLAQVYADMGLDARAERDFRVSLRTSESVRESIRSEEYRLFFLSNTIILYSNFIDFLMSRHRIEDALQVAELGRARTLEEGLGAVSKTLSFPLRDFHPREIARRRNAVLLDYWLAPQQSYLWVITPSKTSSFRLAKQSEIEDLVNEYRGAMQEGKDLLRGGGLTGQRLYSMLVGPAMKMIPQHPRVIILPDASLYRLNFEGLVAPQPLPHYWIEDVTLSMASSLTLLEHSTTRAAAKQKAFC